MSLYIGKVNGNPVLHIANGSFTLDQMRNCTGTATVFHSDLDYLRIKKFAGLTVTKQVELKAINVYMSVMMDMYYCMVTLPAEVLTYLAANGNPPFIIRYNNANIAYGVAAISTTFVAAYPGRTLYHTFAGENEAYYPNTTYNKLTFNMSISDITLPTPPTVDLYVLSINSSGLILPTKTNSEILINNNDILVGGIS